VIRSRGSTVGVEAGYWLDDPRGRISCPGRSGIFSVIFEVFTAVTTKISGLYDLLRGTSPFYMKIVFVPHRKHL
jgi:hypothetical protein